MIKKIEKKDKIWISLFYLFFLSFILIKLINIAHIPISQDRMYQYHAVKEGIEKGTILFTKGPIMSGLDTVQLPSGLYYNILQLAFRVYPHPNSGDILTIFLNALGILLLFYYFKPSMGTVPTVRMCLVLQATPYHVLNSHTYWNPNLLFPFAVLIAIGLHMWLIKHKKIGCYLALFGTIICCQLHLSNIFLLGILMGGILLINYRTIPWKYFILAFATAIVLYLPYLIEEIKNNFINTRAMLSMHGEGGHQTLKFFYFSFLFLTNEISSKIGRGWHTISSFYFDKGILGYIGFLFNLLSLFIFIPLFIRNLMNSFRQYVYPKQKSLKYIFTGKFSFCLDKTYNKEQLLFGYCFVLYWIGCFLIFFFLRFSDVLHYFNVGLVFVFIYVFSYWNNIKKAVYKKILITFIILNSTFLLYWNSQLLNISARGNTLKNLEQVCTQIVAITKNRKIHYYNPDIKDSIQYITYIKYLLKKKQIITSTAYYTILVDGDLYCLDIKYIKKTRILEKGAKLIKSGNLHALIYQKNLIKIKLAEIFRKSPRFYQPEK